MIRKWLRKWQGISLQRKVIDDLQAAARRLNEKLEKLENKAIIGVDLGTRGDAELILIKYNKLTGGIKVIASEVLENPQYQSLIRSLRKAVVEHRAEFLIIDRPKGIADIKDRVWHGLNSVKMEKTNDNDIRRKESVSEKDGI